MITFEYTIAHPVGLYAKLADGLVNIANRYESELQLIYNGKQVSLKSLMGVISLGVPCNGTVVFMIKGRDAKEAKYAIVTFLRDVDPFLV